MSLLKHQSLDASNNKIFFFKRKARGKKKNEEVYMELEWIQTSLAKDLIQHAKIL